MRKIRKISQRSAPLSSTDQKARVRSPLTVLSVTWIIPLSTLASGIVYYEGVSFESPGMLYLAICWGLFLAGFKFGQLRKSYRKLPPLSQMEMNKRLAQDVQRYQRLITLFALAGILAAILFSLEMLFVVRIDMTNLLDVRTAFGERDVTLLSQAATVLGAGGLLSLVAAIVGWGQLSRGRRALWLVSPLLLSTLSLFSAGRQTILQLTLITFFSLLLRGRSTGVRVRRFKMPIVFAGIVMVALAYGMIVSSLRSGESVTGNKGALLSRGFLAQMDTNLETALGDQPAVIRRWERGTPLLLNSSYPQLRHIL